MKPFADLILSKKSKASTVVKKPRKYKNVGGVGSSPRSPNRDEEEKLIIIANHLFHINIKYLELFKSKDNLIDLLNITKEYVGFIEV